MSNAIAIDHADHIAPVALYDRETGLPLPAGGDASAANQALQLAQETAINGKLPASLGGKAGSGSLSVVAATDGFEVVGNAAHAATDSGKPVKIGLKYDPAPASVSTGQRVDAQTDIKGRIAVSGENTSNGDALNPQLNGISGKDGFVRPLQTGVVVLGAANYDRMKKSSSTARLLASAATTNSTLVKSTPGDVFHIIGRNAALTVVYLKLYNKASAPTIGTDTPVMTIPLAPGADFRIDFGTFGHYFITGIGFGLTGAGADADTTAVAANDILGLNFLYA